MPKHTFANFTNLYELSKTLRFELKPQFNTKYFLEQDGVIDKDREVEQNYHEIKKYFDNLHRIFTKDSLSNAYLSLLQDFSQSYLELHKNVETKKDKKLQKVFENVSKELKKELVSFFENTGNIWKQKYTYLKKGGKDILDEKEVLQLMGDFFPEHKNLFQKFDTFFTYFSSFKESRKNFYADDGRAGAIATRAIDENLVTFIKNKQEFESFRGKFSDFVEGFSNEEKQIFDLDFYNTCLLQEGIDNYNKIIGGYSLENGDKVKGINEKINFLKQSHNHSNSKDTKFPRFKILYKQILSEADKSFVIDEIKDEEHLLEVIRKTKSVNTEKIPHIKELIEKFIKNKQDFDRGKIYLSKQAINTLSSKCFESWDYIRNFFPDKTLKDFMSFGEIQQAFDAITYEKNEDVFKSVYIKENIVLDTQSVFENFLNIFYFEFQKKESEVSFFAEKIEKIFAEKFERNEENIEIIKNYFDSVLDVYKMTKYFILEKNKKRIEDLETDNNFYNDFYSYYDDFEVWKEYNLVRNYVTKKQVKTEKFKLNFDNSQFLTGWDKDKEKERNGIILLREGKYFLGILKNSKLFDDYQYAGGDYYEKMNYKQLNNVYRQLPRLVFPLQKKLEKLEGSKREQYLSKYINNFGYTEEIASIKEEFDRFQKSKEKGEKFHHGKLKKLISYYKFGVLFKYSKIYDLEPIRKKDYEELVDFYDDIEKRMYKLDFSKIDSHFIEQKVNAGDLYLFQIYNKDFSETKKIGSKENIHTKYFKLLFDEENLQNLVIKLSGGAEVFFRDKTEHLKQKIYYNKDGSIKEKLFFGNKDGEQKEVLEHRRYTQDKILFHISITLNANAGDQYGFNKIVNEYLHKNKDIKIIGIDRGEKHLAYYSVIDREGNLIETESLNEINEVDYLEKLERIESARKTARASWGEIQNIKELKNGYISAVVNKLCHLICKHNAIIVFEDLNMGFKKGRQKIEKQVYQKLELALAKKLNYLTQKEKANTEVGGYLRALQLTPKINDYQDISNYKQSGIIFYTRANYTSTTCPCCGFRKNIYISNSATKEKLMAFFKDISIQFDGNKFNFSYEIPSKVKNVIVSKTSFCVSSDVMRLLYDSKKMEVQCIDVNQKLQELFTGIDVHGNINTQIYTQDSQFYKALIFYFNLILQVRNSDSKSNKDYISCPVCYFHSDDGFQGKKFNADANGAYNIARKGIIMLNNIEANFEKPNLYVSDEDWDNYLGNFQLNNILQVIDA